MNEQEGVHRREQTVVWALWRIRYGTREVGSACCGSIIDRIVGMDGGKGGPAGLQTGQQVAVGLLTELGFETVYG